MTPDPVIEIRGLRVALGEHPALRSVDLSVTRGTCLALVGPNGAGKSTLLRVLAGLVRPAAGTVLVDGCRLSVDPWHVRRAIGFVGHLSMLHPDLTTRENLGAFADFYGLADVEARVEAGLRQFGLARHADVRVSTLSRGLLQRATLARALLHDPSVLLLDEPETGLDAHAQARLSSALGEGGEHRTVVLASHDLGFVSRVADEVAFLRAGRIVGRVRSAELRSGELISRYEDALAGTPADRSGRAVGLVG